MRGDKKKKQQQKTICSQALKKTFKPDTFYSTLQHYTCSKVKIMQKVCHNFELKSLSLTF